MGLAEAVEQVEVPSETLTEVKRGKKTQVERKTMPGYVLAKLKMNDDVYHLIKNTPKVTGFLGSSGKPQPISEREAARYFGAREEADGRMSLVRLALDPPPTGSKAELPGARKDGQQFLARSHFQ